jgi:aminoglycoside phosphotransferase family enzyme
MAPPMDEMARAVAALPAKVAFLARAASYPEQPAAVETVETHMSWVFLTDRHAFKLKKPVRYEFLDFSTLAARRRNCEEEVRLNLRLAPGVYLGTTPLVQRPDGSLQLGGDGEVIDWLVQMVRLPRDRMLDAALRAGTVREDDVARLADRLAVFYRDAPRVPMAPAAYLARIERDVEADRRELLQPRFGLRAEMVAAVAAGLRDFLGHGRGLLAARARDGWILEAHGDLRPEHVALGPPVAVIDCLEFNAAFRALDPADEIAFLTLECERLGARWVGERVLGAHVQRNADPGAAALVPFHGAARAFLRAKLSVWHLRDGHGVDPGRWITQGAAYLELARASLARARPAGGS